MKIRDSYRIVFMGDGAVGKSSLISQFIDGYFSNCYKPTVEEFFTHSVKLKNGSDYSVQILDTSGTHNFPAMRELAVRTGKGFVLVFSLDNESSFTETIQLYKQIIKIRGNNVPIVLVGNKSDLTRTLTEEMISKRKSLEMDDIPYIETSAKLDRNIRTVFQELLCIAMEHENKLEQNRKLQGKQQAKEVKKARNQQLLRRLSSFGSLPNINLRRKSNSTNHSSNNSIYSENSNSSSSSCNGASDTDSGNGSPKHQTLTSKKSINQIKPMFYSPIIKRKYDNLVKPQLSLDETKIKHLNQRIIHQKILNTQSFDTASTTSSTFSNSNTSSNSTNSSIKGSKESLENNKCPLM